MLRAILVRCWKIEHRQVKNSWKSKKILPSPREPTKMWVSITGLRVKIVSWFFSPRLFLDCCKLSVQLPQITISAQLTIVLQCTATAVGIYFCGHLHLVLHSMYYLSVCLVFIVMLIYRVCRMVCVTSGAGAQRVTPSAVYQESKLSEMAVTVVWSVLDSWEITVISAIYVTARETLSVYTEHVPVSTSCFGKCYEANLW